MGEKRISLQRYFTLSLMTLQQKTLDDIIENHFISKGLIVIKEVSLTVL